MASYNETVSVNRLVTFDDELDIFNKLDNIVVGDIPCDAKKSRFVADGSCDNDDDDKNNDDDDDDDDKDKDNDKDDDDERKQKRLQPQDDAHRVSPCPSSKEQQVSKEGAVVRQYGNIKDRYYITPRILGSGIPGTSVRECIDRLTGQRYAVKSIHKGDPVVNPDCIFREVEHLQEMQYRSIVRLVDVYEDGDCIHLVTDLCTGGELFDRIVERAAPDRRDGGGGCAPCFAEDDAARVIHQVLGAVSYMHSLDVAHMDIKPENILFETADGDSPVKIIDFGLSRRHCGIVERPVSDVVGSPYYMAPEVLAKRYGKSCDLWSVGVIAYILLAGYPPFNGSSNDEVYDAVRSGRYCFDPDDWSGVSVEAMDFVRRLLQLDPRKRMTAQQSLHHPWMVRHGLRTEDDGMLKEEEQVVPQDKSCTDFVYEFVSYAQQSLYHPWMSRHGLRTEDDGMLKEEEQVVPQDKSCTDFVYEFVSYIFILNLQVNNR